MKVVTPTAAIVALACLSLVSAAGDLGFKPSLNNATAPADAPFKQIKTAANFGKAGAKMDICPSGDCTTGQAINLALSRLEEIDATSTVVAKAEKFNQANGTWGDFVTAQINGTAVKSTSYVAMVKVIEAGTVTSTVAFNLTASIFATNGTTMNGNQSVSVPAGGVKFTVAMSGWNFKATANKLRFAVTVKAKAKGVNGTAPAPPQQKKKNGTEAKVNRLDFGEGMFMDAPANAVLDSVDTDIVASVETTGPLTEYVWVFPSFTTSLYYDPVIGSADVSAQVASDTATTTTTTPTPSTTTTPTPSTTTTPTTTKSSASVSSSVAGLVFSGLTAFAAYALC